MILIINDFPYICLKKCTVEAKGLGKFIIYEVIKNNRKCICIFRNKSDYRFHQMELSKYIKYCTKNSRKRVEVFD